MHHHHHFGENPTERRRRAGSFSRTAKMADTSELSNRTSCSLRVRACLFPHLLGTPIGRIFTVLCFALFLGFIGNALIAIVIPTEMAIFVPNHAATASGFLVGFGAFINALGPVVGEKDRAPLFFFLKFFKLKNHPAAWTKAPCAKRSVP
jgi:hypothetical protein